MVAKLAFSLDHQVVTMVLAAEEAIQRRYDLQAKKAVDRQCGLKKNELY